VSATQTLKALRVAGDPVDDPERSRTGGDSAVQRLPGVKVKRNEVYFDRAALGPLVSAGAVAAEAA
jgi:hypothetical protein